MWAELELRWEELTLWEGPGVAPGATPGGGGIPPICNRSRGSAAINLSA